ncbi:hypothetical protein D7V21_09830 [Acinetobacter guerrae]|uniref:Uncharacterized protein n=1 Tax=Acinetobacter guerrae TaxID=1843371 RepID=A0A3A8EHZ6_9GAMM|nr:hypothetical protein [Acinetobacter guerrae]RKG33116.1 hypothetical protein D7V21_09830 [Acinetobacter guerrae]
MGNEKKVGYFLILILFSFMIFFFLKDENSNFKISLIGDDLEIFFPNKIFVRSFEVLDYESVSLNKVNGSFEYKKILSKNYYKDTRGIRINSISNYNIKSNHAYFYQMGQEDVKNPNQNFKTLGFCINKKDVLLQKSREKDADFIKKCHKIN